MIGVEPSHVEKLVFPYEWLDSYDKLSHLGPVPHYEFYSSLTGKNITTEEYEDSISEFHKRECVTMMDWLREYNLADVTPFVESLENTREQYYPNKIDMLNDAVSIPGISMTYVLNKALDMGADLYSPGQPCGRKCQNDCVKLRCKACKQIKIDCTLCAKNKPYELLKTGMIGGPSIVFCRYEKQKCQK